MLSAEEAQRLEPALRGVPGLLGATYAPGSGYVDTQRLMAALEAAAAGAGAEVREGQRLVGAEQSSPGCPRRWRLICEGSAGQTGLSLQGDDVVLAPGAWAAEVGRCCGLDVPVAKVRAQMWSAPARAEPSEDDRCPLSHVLYVPLGLAHWRRHQTLDERLGVPNAVTHSLAGQRHCHHVYGRPGAEGTEVWFGGDRLPLGLGPLAEADFQLDEAAAAENFAEVASLLPALCFRDRADWCGVVGASMHGMPLIGEVQFLPGLWLCTGFG